MTSTSVTPAAAARKPSARTLALRNEMCLTAARLFYQRGYQNVTLKDIGDALGLTAPAIYRHFSGKQDLLRAAISSGLDLVEEIRDHGPRDVDAALAVVASVAIDRRDVWEIIERDSRYLERTDRDAIHSRMAGIDLWMRSLVLKQRPGLDPEVAAGLGRALLAALSAPSEYGIPMSGKPMRRFLRDIATSVISWDESLVTPALELPPGAPRASDFLAKREQVLEQAVRLFGESGFDAVSMADIGDAVGIAGPSIYYYFPSKNDILVTIFRRGLEWLAQDQAQLAAPGSDAAGQLRAYVQAYARLALDHRELFRLFVHERFRLTLIEGQTVIGEYRAFLERWTTVLRSRHPGLSVAEARASIACAMSIINDLAMNRAGLVTEVAATRAASVALSLLEKN